MGTMCGLSKKKHSAKEIPLPSLIPRSLERIPSAELARTGEYLISETSSNKKQKQIDYWSTLLDKPEISFTKTLQKLKTGPPSKYRWRAWLIVLKITDCNFYNYSKLPMAEASVLAEIDKDVARAFPNHPYFNEEAYGERGQGALRRILAKYAAQYQEIGYCQGMNYIIGFLLLVSGGSEVEVYYAFERICELFEYKGLFSHEMSEIRTEICVFSELLRKKFALVGHHFDREMFTEEFWVLKWVITIATMPFPIESAVRIWDNFLVNGRIFIYKLAFAFIEKYQTQLLDMDSGELYDFFQSTYAMKDIEELIKSAYKVNISIKTWSELKNKYNRNYQHHSQLQALDNSRSNELSHEYSELATNRRMSNPQGFLPPIRTPRQPFPFSSENSSEYSFDESCFDVNLILRKILSSPSPNLYPFIQSVLSKKQNAESEGAINFTSQLRNDFTSN